ncbi:hypothetical protein HYW74_04565 [Candidatus Pacearchaeota archaeon]|nr:hypothetical protein [Candidatus Pacearchaeota archaeon]
MTSWDYFVGFEREPKNLDDFLNVQGYDRIPVEGDNTNRNYESREGGSVDLFYFSKLLEITPGDEPDWNKSGLNIVCEVMISTKDSDADIEAERIAAELTKRYKGIFYDPQGKDFLRSEDL